jgi:hypothetical protein
LDLLVSSCVDLPELILEDFLTTVD